jgi:hypothetical protein
MMEFTAADLINIRQTINGLLGRLVYGADTDGNRLRELRMAKANDNIVGWVMERNCGLGEIEKEKNED